MLYEVITPSFETYSRQVIANAKALAGKLMALGYTVVSGGTDNHLMLVDLRNRKLTGKEAVITSYSIHYTKLYEQTSE